jgi:hypothetical protein
MSSSPVTQTNQVVVADKVTKTRQPTLPEKYGKFIQFAYYMMENVLGDEFQMDKAAFLEKIALFGSVGEQQVLVQGFLNGAKDNKKTIKKVVSDRKKAEAKANKPARKSRAKVAAAAAEDGAADAAPAPKRSRKTTKTVVQVANDQLLDDLVQIAAAQTQPAVVQEPVIELVPEPVPEVVVAVVEEKKPKKKAAANKTAAEPVAAADAPLNITNELVPETFIATESETPVKEKAAPKRKSQPKKAAAAKTDTPVLEDVVISGTDIEVSPITIDGKTYFMDESSNLYAHPIPSASSIGKYNPLTRKITHN